MVGILFFGQIDLSLLKISHMDNKQKLEAIIKREEISARQYSDKISEWSQAFLNCLKSANLDTIQVDGDAVWLYIGDINAEFCRLKRRPTNQTKIYNFIDLNSYNRPSLSLKSLTKKTLNVLWFDNVVVDLQHQLTIKQAKNERN